MAQILDIADKDFINIVEEIKKKVLKENMALISENIGNIYKDM